MITSKGDLGRLESQAITNYMKCKKSKHRIPHSAWGNSGYTHKLGDNRLEGSPAERDLQDQTDSELNCQQCARAAAKAECAQWRSKHSTSGWSREVIVPLHTALVQPQLKYYVNFECLRVRRTANNTKRVDKMMKDLKGKTYRGIAKVT